MTNHIHSGENQSLIVIEVPHQMPPRAWLAYNEDDFVDKVEETYGHSVAIYYELSRKSVAECWDEEEVPDELARLLKTTNEVIEVNKGFEPEYYPKDTAPSRFDVYVIFNEHDLREQVIMTLEEAKEYHGPYHRLVESLLE